MKQPREQRAPTLADQTFVKGERLVKDLTDVRFGIDSRHSSVKAKTLGIIEALSEFRGQAVLLGLWAVLFFVRVVAFGG